MNKQFIRKDGRAFNSLRNMKMKVGVLNNADGSAYVECGNNKVLVGVYGPRELYSKKHSKPDGAVLRCKYNMALFLLRNVNGLDLIGVQLKYPSLFLRLLRQVFF